LDPLEDGSTSIVSALTFDRAYDDGTVLVPVCSGFWEMLRCKSSGELSYSMTPLFFKASALLLFRLRKKT
ncbi:hypothetical protein ACTHSO_12250, partial [Neisseria sp. P0009.S004]|uniref:hypothetical protein n=1 Tax=Neisseria sp. P0009.S004 TaxID=3436711 RepID=UPI003F7E8896